MASALTPQQIVAELDKHIIGQDEAKRAVALALRNRWRRMQLRDDLKEEVMPKNILMIGPTGVGKTEIARRLAKLCQAPFIKVEATKFTEIGYVGRDVEQMIRDLVEISLHMTKQRMKKEVHEKAAALAQARILKVLVGAKATVETKEKFKDLLVRGKLNDKEIEIDILDTPASSGAPMFDIPGMPGSQMGMISLGDILGKGFDNVKTKTKKMSVEDALRVVEEEEADKLLDQETIVAQALRSVQDNGIVFIDEIDKVCARHDQRGGEVSREGVQRDLLPLIEGTTVTTKHGTIKTDHILFITSGAFHVAKPSDLLPELQGRLPIRVELKALKKADFVAILTQTQANLIEQSVALLGTENVTLSFDDGAINTIAELAENMNTNVENIGARRLHTLIEKLIEDISFEASEKAGQNYTITHEMVESRLTPLVQHQDLSRFVL